MNQPQSLLTLFQLVLCCPTSSLRGNRSLEDGPALGCDNPPMLLLGLDSRSQQVKKVMPAIGAKKDSRHVKYPMSINLPSPAGSLPPPHPQGRLSSLKHSHPHVTPLGFLFSSETVPKVYPNQISAFLRWEGCRNTKRSACLQPRAALLLSNTPSYFSFLQSSLFTLSTSPASFPILPQ